jgi:ribosomal protein S18 acetylase RimI-like enzyme
VIKQHGLTADDLAEARRLQDLCNLYEGLDLPMSLEPGQPGEPENQFVFYRDDAALGVLTLQARHEIEACLAVHPGARRQGIGRALLAAAVDECRRRGAADLLLVCDEASAPGRAFAAAVGGSYRNSEYRMRLDPKEWRTLAAGPAFVQLQRVGDEDLDALTRIVATVFEAPADQERQRIARDLSRTTHRFFVAHTGGETVGSVGVATVEGRSYIIALGVLPAHRGKGYGRAMLQSIVAALVAEGHPEILIEVGAENRGALSLYRSCGFREIASYGFYRVLIS